MLDFLATATINDVAEIKTAGAKGGPRKQRNPEGLAIRVFRDGSVYPSPDLVSMFDLEYANKPAEGQSVTGNGFDVIDTKLYPTFQVGRRILIISPVAKASAKVDLFASTTYNEDNTPKSSVLDQGSKTFGSEELIPMIEEIYGIKFRRKDENEGAEYVDMLLIGNPATQQPWMLPNGKSVTFIPKKVSRGADKGAVTTTRRENPVFYAFLPAEVVNGTQATAEKEEVSHGTDEVAKSTEETAATELPARTSESPAVEAQDGQEVDASTEDGNPFKTQG